MKFAKGLLIFCYGLFAIGAQTLLFREFITTFEGNDISVGIFFWSWFLWVGLGAVLVYRAGRFAHKLLNNIEFLSLAYVPAFVLQAILILKAREITGVEPYALWSVKTILLSATIINAPVSIITGMLFPVACRWISSNQVKQDGGIAVSLVYIIEAAGSFVGGVGVTILLGLGTNLVTIFFVLIFVLTMSIFAVRIAKGLMSPVSPNGLSGVRNNLSIGQISASVISFLIPVSVCLALVFGADKTLMRYMQIIKWTRLFPEAADAELAGSFQTAQAEYLYGTYQGRWITVREGGVVEALPDESSAAQTTAITLCQKPDANEILVIGSGLGLCGKFLEFPQIENVTWSDCDSQYVQNINKFVPAEFQITDNRFAPLAGDIRPMLEQKKRVFDIVILNLPEATTSVLNRYYTLEFYNLLKQSLRPDGILAVRMAGGENIMGTELINLGASARLTLEKVFSRLVLVPGEETWLIASDSAEITGNPAVLRDRFASIQEADNVFAPAALLSIYLPDRAETAMNYYSSADLPENLLINRDTRPLTYLYNLLLTAKQSGAPAARFIKLLALAGPWAFIVPILVFLVLRIIYISSYPKRDLVSEKKGTSFDSSFLVFSAGWIGIGVVIVLMYMYQTRFGSLYLHIGIVSSLFMVGLTIGAAITGGLLGGNRTTQSQKLLLVLIFVHSLLLYSITLLPAEQLTHQIFAIAFVLCGLCAGGYFPIAAGQLADSALETGSAGSKLETADHIGASAGGLLTSLALVPVLGAKVTLLVFILLIVANLPVVLIKIFKKEKIIPSVKDSDLELRNLGYTLFGVGLSIVLCSNLLVRAGERFRSALPEHAAQALAGQLHIERATSILSGGDKKITYYKVFKTDSEKQGQFGPSSDDELTGYIFSSTELAPEVVGFGGKINLAIYVDKTDGKLVDYSIIQSNETPEYLELLSEWHDSLSGRSIFAEEPFYDVHAVTGATISSNAILSALQNSGRRFAAEVLGLSLQPQAAEKTWWAGFLSNYNGIYLICVLILALLVTYFGGFWSRLAVLLSTLAVGGFRLNAQYSSEQIATILSLQAPALRLTGPFIFIVGIPLLVIIFGNIYCGYICPFGAAQELLGYLVPQRFKSIPAVKPMRKARFVKYIVLLVLIVVFFLSRNRTTLSADPLISIFNFRFVKSVIHPAILWIAVAGLIGSIFYTRFWCRYLCPVGAFLAILNKIAILKRYLPKKRFGRCEFGLTAADNMDCIHCDRCRFQLKAISEKKYIPHVPSTPVKFQNPYFLTAVIVIAVLISLSSINRLSRVVSTGFDQTVAVITTSSGGRPRDVDLQRVRTMIEQNKLSDKEAEFYRKAD